MKHTMARVAEWFGGHRALRRMTRDEFSRADETIKASPGPEALGDAMKAMRLRFENLGARIAARNIGTCFGTGALAGFGAVALHAPHMLGVVLFSASAAVGAVRSIFIMRRAQDARNMVGLPYQDATADEFFRNTTAFMESPLVKVKTPQERLRLHKAFGQVRNYVRKHQGEINAARQAAMEISGP